MKLPGLQAYTQVFLKACFDQCKVFQGELLLFGLDQFCVETATAVLISSQICQKFHQFNSIFSFHTPQVQVFHLQAHNKNKSGNQFDSLV